MRVVEKAKWKDIQSKVKNMEGKKPKSQHCVKNAVQRVQASGKKGVAMTNYKNCGGKRALTHKRRRWLFSMCTHGGRSFSALANTSKKN